VTEEGNQITVFDLQTEEQQLVTLQSNLYQAAIYEDKLYTTDADIMNVSLNTYVLSITERWKRLETVA